MTDGEVLRLRAMRKTALRARAIAVAIDRNAPRGSVLSRGAQNCWQIARTITGRLRAHPYLNFQQDPSEARALYDRFTGSLLSIVAKYRGRSVRFYADELRRVARELDDARALTWSTDLSDDFGRVQGRMRRIIMELEAAALSEAGSPTENAGSGNDGSRNAGLSNAGLSNAGSRVASRSQNAASDVGSVEGNWPYLAI